MTERVSRLEGIAEETRHRHAENHAEHQTLGEKIDRQGDAIRAEVRQGDAALDAKIDRLRADQNRQTCLLIGAMGAFAAIISALTAFLTRL